MWKGYVVKTPYELKNGQIVLEIYNRLTERWSHKLYRDRHKAMIAMRGYENFVYRN